MPVPEANFPKLGDGPKMGQNEFDCACFCVFHMNTSLVFHSPFTKQVGRGSIGSL